MKRWLLRLGLAALTFTFGIGVYFFTQTVVIHQRVQRSSGPLPYCEVARNAETYHDQEIVVNARIFVGESGVFVYEDCDPVEALAAFVVTDEKHPFSGPSYVDDLLLDDNKPNMRTAQALIRGRFDANWSTGCYGPKFRINAKRIELRSSLTEYTPPQTDEGPTRSKH
jgi:hypothetical protein